jgi:hypothetical protein
MTLLEDWAFAHYENVTEEAVEVREIRRLTERAFKHIRDQKKHSMLESADKIAKVKIADKRVERIENRGKITQQFIEGAGAFTGDANFVVKWLQKLDEERAEEAAKRDAKLAEIREAKQWKFTDRRQTLLLTPVAPVVPVAAVKNAPMVRSIKERMQEQREDEDMVSAFSKRKMAGEKQTSKSPRPTAAQPTTRLKNAGAVPVTPSPTLEAALSPQVLLKRACSKVPPRKALPMPPQGSEESDSEPR